MAIAIANPPEAKPERISRLVARIESGDIKIPKFQRGFIWTRDQILELLDSIYRGYPIGSLLLWLTKEKLARERKRWRVPPAEYARGVSDELHT